VVEIEGEAILRCSIYQEPVPGDARFASGDVFCDIRYCTVAGSSPQVWHGLYETGGFGSAGTILASSYAKIGGTPTFLMGGNDAIFIFTGHAVIMASDDGLAWSVGFSLLNYYVSDLVWDADDAAFYANVIYYTLDPASDLCFRSADGYTWEEHESNFWDHTADGVTPDGHAGYDPGTGLRIFPGDLGLDFMDVNCTAFADGIWMAGGELTGGGSATATSLDGGVTWSLVTSGEIEDAHDQQVATMVAAPMSDLE
jgi:hypothetical protein